MSSGFPFILFQSSIDPVVVWDPEIMDGAPIFRGTRVLIQCLFDHLDAGDSVDDFLEGFPSVSRQQVETLLQCPFVRLANPRPGRQN